MLGKSALIKNRNTARVIKFGLAAAVWAAAVVFVFTQRERINAAEIAGAVPSSGFLTALALLAFFAFKSVTVVIFCGIIYAVSSVLYPLPIALCINVLGTLIMCSIPYFFGRKGGSALAQGLEKKHPKIASLKKTVCSNGFLFVFLTRVVNVLPLDPVSLYFGAAGVGVVPYLAGSLCGMLPLMLAFTFLGEIVVSGGNIPYWALYVFAGISVCAAAVILLLKYRKPKNRKE